MSARIRVSMVTVDGASIALIGPSDGLERTVARLRATGWEIVEDEPPADPGRFSVAPAPLVSSLVASPLPASA